MINSKTRLIGLILILTKEFFIGSHLCIGSISYSLAILKTLNPRQLGERQERELAV